MSAAQSPLRPREQRDRVKRAIASGQAVLCQYGHVQYPVLDARIRGYQWRRLELLLDFTTSPAGSRFPWSQPHQWSVVRDMYRTGGSA